MDEHMCVSHSLDVVPDMNPSVGRIHFRIQILSRVVINLDDQD